MDDITLGQIASAVTFLAGFIGGVAYLSGTLKKWLSKALRDELKPLQDKIDRVDMESTKNFLVRCIADFEHGGEISETEKERFYEQYEHYTACGGNSYIRHKVEQLQANGVL